MKFKLAVILLFIYSKGFSQNIITTEGAFMDTTTNISGNCRVGGNIYYYSVNGKYPKNSASLLADARQFLGGRSNNYSGNGYISFRFTINCEGTMLNKVQVLQTDTLYKNCQFDKALINELYAFIKTLKQWKIAKTKTGISFNYKTFLTFKVNNGEIINIIP